MQQVPGHRTSHREGPTTEHRTPVARYEQLVTAGKAQMNTRESESARGLSRLKDFSRSAAITYTASLVISRKRCKIEISLLQTTNSKWHDLSNSGNADDLECPSRSFTHCKPFQMGFFVQLCSRWQNFNCHSASRAPIHCQNKNVTR